MFIVRLWRERREIQGAASLLRGTVEHVPSGDRCAVRDLSGVLRFLHAYVDGVGLDLDCEYE